jgi:hypothetical protein
MQSTNAAETMYVDGVAHTLVNGELIREDGAEVAKGARPTPRQIDELVELFEAARDEAELADERYTQHKNVVIALVQRFGIVPKGAESSLRLEGQLTILTVTTGNSSTLKDEGVSKLQRAMQVNKQLGLFEKMFHARVKYSQRKGAAVELRVAKLSQRLADKFTTLYNACFAVTAKSPSLKVERLGDKKVAAKKGGR